MTIRLEQLALLARYVAFAVCFGLYQAGELEGEGLDLAIATAAVFIHNAISHVVLWRKWYAFFNSRWNFILYLLEFSLVVQFTGGEESEFAVLYLFLIAGFTLYSMVPERIYTVTVLCLFAYTGIIFFNWWMSGTRLDGGNIILQLASIPATGWLICTLTQPLRVAREAVKKRSHDLIAAEAMLRAIFDATAQPVIVLDDRDAIIDANRGATYIFGTSRQTLLGKGLTSLFGSTMARNILSDIRLKGESHGECQISDQWECSHTVELDAHSFVRLERNFMVIVLHDVTHQRALEKASEQTNAKLAHLNLELLRVSEMRGQLVAELAQRIRSPLTATLGYLEMILKDEAGPISVDQRNVLLSCRKSATHIMETLEKTATVPGIESAQISTEIVSGTTTDTKPDQPVELAKSKDFNADTSPACFVEE